MEIKYTSDGKKVAVLGKLNTTTFIVQEIFIINEQEIPSGENFTVNSLHEAPALSWKQSEITRLKEINERLVKTLEGDKDAYNKRIDAQRKKYSEEAKILSDKFKFIAGAVKNADESSFNMLLAFLEGRIKYLVMSDYYSPRIVDFKFFVEKYSDSDYWSGINLISLWGKDDGTLQYRVGDYYDGYKTFTNVAPCETEGQAVDKLTEIISGVKEYNEYVIAEAKKYNIELDVDKLNKYTATKKERIEKQIAEYEKSISTQKELLKAI